MLISRILEKKYQIIGKNVAKNKLEEENDLQCKLTKAEFELQNCLDDPVLLNELTFIKHQHARAKD